MCGIFYCHFTDRDYWFPKIITGSPLSDSVALGVCVVQFRGPCCPCAGALGGWGGAWRAAVVCMCVGRGAGGEDGFVPGGSDLSSVFVSYRFVFLTLRVSAFGVSRLSALVGADCVGASGCQHFVSIF